MKPQSPSFRLSGRDFQPLLSPQPLHPLVIHFPPFPTKHGRDPSVAVSPVSAWPTPPSQPPIEPHHLGYAFPFAGSIEPVPALGRPDVRRRALLPISPSPTPLRRLLFVGPRSFLEETSFRICLSKDRSATSFFNRAFSFSNTFQPLGLIQSKPSVLLGATGSRSARSPQSVCTPGPPSVLGLDLPLPHAAS